jgi:hypothetical protein
MSFHDKFVGAMSFLPKGWRDSIYNIFMILMMIAVLLLLYNGHGLYRSYYPTPAKTEQPKKIPKKQVKPVQADLSQPIRKPTSRTTRGSNQSISSAHYKDFTKELVEKAVKRRKEELRGLIPQEAIEAISYDRPLLIRAYERHMKDYLTRLSSAKVNWILLDSLELKKVSDEVLDSNYHKIVQ